MPPDPHIDDLLDSWEKLRGITTVDSFIDEYCGDALSEVVEELRIKIQRLEAMNQLIGAAKESRQPNVSIETEHYDSDKQVQSLPKFEPGFEIMPGYKLKKILGEGGFGEVWEASAPGGFAVALKIVHLKEGSKDPEYRAVRITRQLRHPNLLSIHGAWEGHGLLVVTMELADGSLQNRFDEATKPPGVNGINAGELRGYMSEAALAIDYLNSPKLNSGNRTHLGIQHRDIKPHNLLLVDGHIKIADFGIARALEHERTGHTGALTPAFAAPEFFKGETSRYSDQYSLAVTYCYLRGGRFPFAGSPERVMYGHLNENPDLTMLPREERSVLARALAKEPEARWPSCQEFITQFEVHKNLPVSEKPPPQDHNTPSPPRHNLRKEKRPTASQALVDTSTEIQSTTFPLLKRPARKRSFLSYCTRFLVSITLPSALIAILIAVVLTFEPSKESSSVLGSKQNARQQNPPLPDTNPQTYTTSKPTSNNTQKANISQPIKHNNILNTPKSQILLKNFKTCIDKGDPKKAIATFDKLTDGLLFPQSTKSAARLFQEVLLHFDNYPKNSKANHAIAQTAHSLIDPALKSLNFQIAQKLSDLALLHGKDTNHILREITARWRYLKDIQPDFNNLNDTADELLLNPKDTKANRLIGIYRCCVLHDWDLGLNNLARSDVKSLRDAAAFDLTQPVNVKQQIELAKKWWDLGQTNSSGVIRAGYLWRSYYWYEKVFYSLPKSKRSVIDKRMESIQKELIDNETIGVLRNFNKNKDHPSAVAFSPNGRLFASADEGGVHLWSTNTGEMIRNFKTGSTNNEIEFSPDGQSLAFGNLQNNVSMINYENGDLIKEFPGKTVREVRFSLNGNQLLVADYDIGVTVWDIKAKKRIQVYNVKGAWGASFQSSGRHILYAADHRWIRRYLSSGHQDSTRIGPHPSDISCMDISPNGQLAVTGTAEGTVHLWNLQTKKQEHILVGHAKFAIDVKFSPDGKRVLSCGKDDLVLLWDVATGTEIHRYEDIGGWDANFSPDGRRAVSCGKNATLIRLPD